MSNALTFAATAPAVLSVNATTVAPGASVTMTLTNSPGGAYDWLALALTSAANSSYATFTYVGAGVTTRSIDVVLELLRLGVTFSTEPFVMPPRHGKSSDDDGRHDCKDNSRPGSRGHRFMVTKPPRSSPESVRASPNVGVSVTCGFIEERGEADDG